MNINEVIAAFIAALAVVISLFAYRKVKDVQRTAENARLYQMLTDMLLMYRSVEMHVAIQTLWKFFRKCADKKYTDKEIGQSYITRMKDDDARIDNVPSDQRFEQVKATLHFQRRLVSKYFLLFANLKHNGVFMFDEIYGQWSKIDLEIIPDILLPIEYALLKELKGKDTSKNVRRLKNLYDDCPEEESDLT